MELAEPSIATAFDRCVAGGATTVAVAPYFLGPGSHWDRDIPALAAAAAAGHPGVRWLVAAPLGPDPRLLGPGRRTGRPMPGPRRRSGRGVRHLCRHRRCALPGVPGAAGGRVADAVSCCSGRRARVAGRRGRRGPRPPCPVRAWWPGSAAHRPGGRARRPRRPQCPGGLAELERPHVEAVGRHDAVVSPRLGLDDAGEERVERRGRRGSGRGRRWSVPDGDRCGRRRSMPAAGVARDGGRRVGRDRRLDAAGPARGPPPRPPLRRRRGPGPSAGRRPRWPAGRSAGTARAWRRRPRRRAWPRSAAWRAWSARSWLWRACERGLVGLEGVLGGVQLVHVGGDVADRQAGVLAGRLGPCRPAR